MQMGCVAPHDDGASTFSRASTTAFLRSTPLKGSSPDDDVSSIFSLTRSFHLVRHQDDARLERMNRIAALLSDGIRREVAQLEGELDKMSQAAEPDLYT